MQEDYLRRCILDSQAIAIAVKDACAGFDADDGCHSDEVEAAESFFVQVILCSLIPFTFGVIEDQHAVGRQVIGGEPGTFNAVAAIHNDNVVL